ncbi:MAG TPA: hypothetical protein V6C58_12585 [Allocoleopsis sp.]
MRGLSLLDIDGEDYDDIMDYVEGKNSRPCIQDLFLEKLCKEIYNSADFIMKHNGYAMEDPIVMHPYDKYVFCGNHRHIVDQSKTDIRGDKKNMNIIRAYFDSPVKKSPLMLVIDDPNIIPLPQVFNSIGNLTNKLFRSTKFTGNTYPVTIQIDFVPTFLGDVRCYVPGTLEYTKKTSDENSLFDVYDTWEIDLKKSLWNVCGINFEKTYEELFKENMGLKNNFSK